VALVDSVSPHLSNVDVLPLKRKELREYILVSPVSSSRLLLTLTRLLAYLFTCLLDCLPKVKFYVAPIHPPLVAPYILSLCLHYALCLMRLSVVRNLILKGSSDDSP
jgi:hypothetical protein